MRRCGIAAVVASACSFSPSSSNTSGDGGTIDARPGVDARDGGSGSGSGSGTRAACLTSSTYTAGSNGHRYRRVDGGSDRDAAYDECTADGAYLAQISDDAENLTVSTFITGLTWIGLDDTVTEMTFAWVNGSTSPYRHFAANEPNDGGPQGPGEDCVYIDTNASHTWNDSSCAASLPAVCECDATYVPPPTPACRTQAGWTAVQGRRYKYVSASRDWDAAEADCQAAGAYLMVPSDLDENNRINGQLEIGTKVWIGMRRTSAADFAPVDGEPTSLVNFDGSGSGSPMGSAASDKSCVVVANPNGNWENHKCSDGNPYVCECDPAHPQPAP